MSTPRAAPVRCAEAREGGWRDLTELGRRLTAFARTAGSYAFLGDAGTWTAGGCWLLARALREVAGGELVAVVGDDGVTHHVAVKVGDVYLDADGASSRCELELRWRDQERVAGARVAPFDAETTARGGMAPLAERHGALVVALRERLGGRSLGR